MATSWSAWLRRKFSFLGRRAKRRPLSKSQNARLRLELLEDRCLLSWTLTPETNVNIGHLFANQSEPTIAIDPIFNHNLFAAANNNSGTGLFACYSIDGGQHWTPSNLAGLPTGLT